MTQSTEWHRVVAWGRYLRNYRENMPVKGQYENRVSGGKIKRSRTYTTDDGTKVMLTEVEAKEKIPFVGKTQNAMNAEVTFKPKEGVPLKITPS